MGSGQVKKQHIGAVIWHYKAEDVWVVSVQPAGEIDIGQYASPHEAVGHLNEWADQRGLVVKPTEPWLDEGTNYFDIC